MLSPKEELLEKMLLPSSSVRIRYAWNLSYQMEESCLGMKPTQRRAKQEMCKNRHLLHPWTTWITPYLNACPQVFHFISH